MLCFGTLFSADFDLKEQTYIEVGAKYIAAYDIPPELVQDEKAKAQQKATEQKQLEQQNAQLKQKAEAEKKLAEQNRQATAEAERKAAEEK